LDRGERYLARRLKDTQGARRDRSFAVNPEEGTGTAGYAERSCELVALADENVPDFFDVAGGDLARWQPDNYFFRVRPMCRWPTTCVAYQLAARKGN